MSSINDSEKSIKNLTRKMYQKVRIMGINKKRGHNKMICLNLMIIMVIIIQKDRGKTMIVMKMEGIQCYQVENHQMELVRTILKIKS